MRLFTVLLLCLSFFSPLSSAAKKYVGYCGAEFNTDTGSTAQQRVLLISLDGESYYLHTHFNHSEMDVATMPMGNLLTIGGSNETVATRLVLSLNSIAAHKEVSTVVEGLLFEGPDKQSLEKFTIYCELDNAFFGFE